jgi:hypothetical protein
MHAPGWNGSAFLHLFAVKSLRVWLLVLLAFALPMKGAMAVAVLCAGESGHVHASVAAGNSHDHANPDSGSAHDSHAKHDHASGQAHDVGDKCSACASCCSASAPIAAAFVLPQASPATAEFPSHRTPTAEFLSDGQERPPRSI